VVLDRRKPAVEIPQNTIKDVPCHAYILTFIDFELKMEKISIREV